MNVFCARPEEDDKDALDDDIFSLDELDFAKLLDLASVSLFSETLSIGLLESPHAVRINTIKKEMKKNNFFIQTLICFNRG